MDYYNEVVFKQENERAWVTYIKGKVNEENNSFPCMVVGKTGSGKSYSVLRLCQEIDPEFELEGNWFFRAENFMKEFTSYYKNRDNAKSGKIWVLDEAGVDLNSLKYHNSINKAYSSLFQTSRFRNYIFFGTVPFLDFITKQVRKLMHHRMDAKGVENNKSVVFPRCLEWNERKEDFYTKRLICQFPDGSQSKINRMLLPLARKALITEYEKRRRDFSDNVNQELVHEQEAIIEKQNQKNDYGSITAKPNYMALIAGLKDGKSHYDIADSLNISLNRLHVMQRALKKFGYGFRCTRAHNRIYFPELQEWRSYRKIEEPEPGETKSLNST